MKRTLLILGLATALLAFAAWAGLGANRGWTRTSVPVKTVDEVTGIEAIQYRKTFVPGIEVLGGALCVASLIGGASFLIKNNNNTLSK